MNTDETYLRAIYCLEQCQNGRVETGTVARRLDVTHPTATDMITKLATEGWVDHEKYQGVVLTEQGRDRAIESLSGYCTLQRFLSEVLGVEGYQAEADAIEPVIDGEVAAQLSGLVDSSETCPDCFDPVAGRCSQLDPAKGEGDD